MQTFQSKVCRIRNISDCKTRDKKYLGIDEFISYFKECGKAISSEESSKSELCNKSILSGCYVEDWNLNHTGDNQLSCDQCKKLFP